MDAEFRKEQIKKLPAKALKRIVLPELDREYTLSEIAIITSAGPARALGLTQKGHLGVGADADVAIYQREARTTACMFAYPRYVIKGGEVVVEEGEIRNVGRGPRVHRPARATTRRSRSTSGRCSSSTTRCRSRTTRWRSSGCDHRDVPSRSDDRVAAASCTDT